MLHLAGTQAMGGGAGAETSKKPLRAGDSDAASVPPVEQQQQQQSPIKPAAAGVPGSAADGSAAVQSCGEDDQDDEQVERFYTLLANIRALRGLYSAGGDGGGTGPATTSGGRGRKRAREAETPWRPAFRLEDFEQVVNQGTAADARCAVTDAGTGGDVARQPAAARARADDGHEEDKAARGGNKLGRRVAARG